MRGAIYVTDLFHTTPQQMFFFSFTWTPCISSSFTFLSFSYKRVSTAVAYSNWICLEENLNLFANKNNAASFNNADLSYELTVVS